MIIVLIYLFIHLFIHSIIYLFRYVAICHWQGEHDHPKPFLGKLQVTPQAGDKSNSQ